MKSRRSIYSVLLGAFVVFAMPVESAAQATSRLRHLSPHDVERSFTPLKLGDHGEVVPITLERLMALNRVPALSVAVIDNYQIAWAKAYGFKAPGEKEHATTRTLFLAGSVSKSVTAVGMMSLVEQQRLSLDEDVNLKLRSWKVPDNEYTKTQKVTLRRIASHTAGLSVFGFGGYAVGEDRPTLQQVLDGQPPANSEPVRVVSVPGSGYSYSGGGTTIEQQVMIDVVGEPFPKLMKRMLFDPLGMTDSTFEQPLPQSWEPRAASGAEADGRLLAGRWHIFPEMAAAGLWTTPTDLARLTIDVALSAKGRGRILSAPLAREMLAPQPEGNGEATLGFFIRAPNPSVFLNNGSDIGFKAMLRMDVETGQGAIIMTNSENGFLVATEYMEAIANAYGWKVMPTKRIGGRHVLLVAKVAGVDAALAAFDDLKRAPTEGERPTEQTLAMVGDRLFEAGDRSNAITVYERNAREYPNSAAAHLSLGKAYAETSQPDRARKSIEMSLALDPASSEAKEALSKLGPP